MIPERKQELLDRIQEDERLRGDLEDTAARELVAWALRKAEQAIDAGERADDEIEAHVQAVRSAARAAARSGALAPQKVIQLAEKQLAEALPPVTPLDAAAPPAALLGTPAADAPPPPDLPGANADLGRRAAEEPVKRLAGEEMILPRRTQDRIRAWVRRILRDRS
jgi:hypothetical protein